MSCTLREDQCVFWIMPLLFLLRMTKASDISCRENQNTHFVFNNFFSENHAVF
jgi:hypothetical protein